jgi:hypothetical protein
MREPDYLVNRLLEWLEATFWPRFPGDRKDLKSLKSPQKPCHKPDFQKKKKKLC